MTENLRHHIDEAMLLAAGHLGQGRVADYIPALARVDPNKLGFALALPDGTVHTSGDADEAFSIQSVSKVFTLALCCPSSRRLWSGCRGRRRCMSATR